jgi:glucans biosynthesis protein C
MVSMLYEFNPPMYGLPLRHFLGLLAWLWLIGLLGLGQRFMNFSNPFLVYGNEAVLPFYILHHTIILIIRLPVLGWNKGVSVKFIVAAVISFIVITAIYEVLVRRLNIFRFLFGMKRKI